METKVPGWTSPEEEAEKRRLYHAEMVRRYQAGLPMSKIDKREARRLIKEASAFAKESA